MKRKTNKSFLDELLEKENLSEQDFQKLDKIWSQFLKWKENHGGILNMNKSNDEVHYYTAKAELMNKEMTKQINQLITNKIFSDYRNNDSYYCYDNWIVKKN